MLYFLVYLLLVFWGCKHIKNPQKTLKRDLFVVLLIFISIAGLRFEIGVDYFAYQRHFLESENIFQLFSSQSHFLKDMFSGWEPGSIILFSLLKTFSSDPQILFFVSSIICSYLLFKSLKYFCESRYIILTLLIYFCFVYMYQEMHALRQALGASIFYYGLIFLGKGNRSRAILTTLLASCFHYSIVLFLPLIYILDRPIRNRFQLLSLIISFIIFLLRIPWMNLILDYLASLLPELGIVMRVMGYTEGDQFQRPFFITFILYLVPYLFIMYCNRKKNISDARWVISQNLYFLYLILTMIFWEYSFFSIRYGWICLFGMAVCLPQIIPVFKQRIIPILYIIVFCFVPIKTFLFPDLTTGQFSPYENYISVEILGQKATGRERAEQYAAEVGGVLK